MTWETHRWTPRAIPTVYEGGHGRVLVGSAVFSWAVRPGMTADALQPSVTELASRTSAHRTPHRFFPMTMAPHRMSISLGAHPMRWRMNFERDGKKRQGTQLERFHNQNANSTYLVSARYTIRFSVCSISLVIQKPNARRVRPEGQTGEQHDVRPALEWRHPVPAARRLYPLPALGVSLLHSEGFHAVLTFRANGHAEGRNGADNPEQTFHLSTRLELVIPSPARTVCGGQGGNAGTHRLASPSEYARALIATSFGWRAAPAARGGTAQQ